MPPGNEGQLTDVDLDQKIAERSRAIALNQNDAKAYRDRGLLLARKREYDLAMGDLNKALLLNPNPKRLLEISRVCSALTSCDVAASDLAAIKSFSLEKLATLNSVIEQIEALRMSVFGYLFAGKGLQKTAKILRDECKIETDKPQRQLSKLKSLRNHFNDVRDHLVANGIEAEFETAIFLILTDLAGTGKKPLAPAAVLNSTQKLEEAMSLSTPLLAGAKGGFYRAMLEANEGSLSLVNRLAELKASESGES